MDKETFSQEFCQRLRSAREQAGLSQSEVGRRIGKSQNTVNEYESGKAKPPIGVLRQLADLYDVSLDYLAARTGTPRPPAEGGETMPIENREPLKSRLDRIEVTVHILEQVIRRQILPTEWARLERQARRALEQDRRVARDHPE